MKPLATAVLVLAAASAGLPSQAMIMRHDRPESRYRDLGESYRPYIVQIGLLSRTGAPMLFNGMGTMVAPRWVITAAHVAEPLVARAPNRDPAGHVVFVMGRGHKVSKVFIHPDYKDGAGPDVALILLEAPVADARFACLYRNRDELGKRIVMAGMGLPGDGKTGVGKPDGALRGATVRVDAVSDDPANPTMSWTFRPPEDPLSTDLEGISGPGDSGGPAFIETPQGLCIAGVSSGQDSKGGPEGLYGVVETYPRVSGNIAWIDGVMRANTDSAAK